MKQSGDGELFVDTGRGGTKIEGGGSSVPGGAMAGTNGADVFQTAIDSGNYLAVSSTFRYFIDNLPDYVSEKLNEHEEKTRKKIDKYLSGIEKFKADKEAHDKKLRLIREEFNKKFSLDENKAKNEEYVQEENELTQQISQIIEQTQLAKVTILQKKEIVLKYKEMVKSKAKHNIRLTALAEKLAYELEKAKKEAEILKEAERKSTVSGKLNPYHNNSHVGTSSVKASSSATLLPKLQGAQVIKNRTTKAQHQGTTPTDPKSANSVKTLDPKTNEGGQAHARKGPSTIQRQLTFQFRKATKMFLRDLDIFTLFRDCLTSYFGYVRKTQEITQADGLNGSMLFELIHKSTQGKVGYPHLADTVKWDKIKTELQERHMVSAVYESLKQEITKRRRDKLTSQRKFNVSWEQLKAFNPLQVMGLLVMQWTVLGDILLEWEHFLHKKAKIVRKHKPPHA